MFAKSAGINELLLANRALPSRKTVYSLEKCVQGLHLLHCTATLSIICHIPGITAIANLIKIAPDKIYQLASKKLRERHDSLGRYMGGGFFSLFRYLFSWGFLAIGRHPVGAPRDFWLVQHAPALFGANSSPSLSLPGPCPPLRTTALARPSWRLAPTLSAAAPVPRCHSSAPSSIHA